MLTCLLRAGNINGVTFGAVALSVLLLSYVVYRGEAVSEVDLKDLKVKMQQVEQVRQEVFAKAEAVQRLGEELAALGVWNGRTVNRFVGEQHQVKMLRQRDQIAAMLRQLGTSGVYSLNE